MDDDWARCDAEAVVAALSVRYRFSRANAVQLLRDEGILRPRAEAEHEADDDVEEAEAWGSEEEEEEDDEDEGLAAIIPMPGQDLVSVGAMVVGTGAVGFKTARRRRRCSAVSVRCCSFPMGVCWWRTRATTASAC